MNPDEWAKDFTKRTPKHLLKALKDSISEQLDAIGRRAGRTFHTTGAGANTKGGFKYSGKNASGRLRVRSGNLKRSIEARGGKHSNSIRVLKVRNNVVTAEIGTDAQSKDGFSYPYFHEFGRFPFLMPSIEKEQSSYVKRFNKHWDKMKI